MSMFSLNSLPLALSLAASLALGPGSATAQKVSNSVVAADLRACIEAAPLPDDVPACRGRPSHACEDRVPGQPSIKLSIRCMDAEAEAWRKVLDLSFGNREARLRQLDTDTPLAGAGAARVDRLSAAQAAWRIFRDAECAQVAGAYLPASMADYSLAACEMNMTADRALDLMMMEEF